MATDNSVAITDVRFEGEEVRFTLDDGREVSIPITHKYLRWLKDATPQQRANWRVLEPDGWAVEWPDLDDGIEVEHLLKFLPA